GLAGQLSATNDCQEKTSKSCCRDSRLNGGLAVISRGMVELNMGNVSPGVDELAGGVDVSFAAGVSCCSCEQACNNSRDARHVAPRVKQEKPGCHFILKILVLLWMF